MGFKAFTIVLKVCMHILRLVYRVFEYSSSLANIVMRMSQSSNSARPIVPKPYSIFQAMIITNATAPILEQTLFDLSYNNKACSEYRI